MNNALIRYAKFIVALIGAIISSILATVDGPPRWLVILSAGITAAGVYLAPYAPTGPTITGMRLDPTKGESLTLTQPGDTPATPTTPAPAATLDNDTNPPGPGVTR